MDNNQRILKLGALALYRERKVVLVNLVLFAIWRSVSLTAVVQINNLHIVLLRIKSPANLVSTIQRNLTLRRVATRQKCNFKSFHIYLYNLFCIIYLATAGATLSVKFSPSAIALRISVAAKSKSGASAKNLILSANISTE